MFKSILKKLISLTPYRIVRRAENRFDAIEFSLRLLRSLGYRPLTIVDGGAHLGVFAKVSSIIFPEAEIHLVEPQPACSGPLKELARAAGFTFHPFALGSAEDETRGLKLAVADQPTTGAHITEEGTPVEVRTLDSIIPSKPSDRLFIKLDLQGFELRALLGAERLLKDAEVILTEVSFFRQAYEPRIEELIAFLSDQNFELFDIAALSGRGRDNRLRQGDFVFVKRGSQLLADTAWS